MLFELINALVTCQQMINDAFKDLLNIIIIAYLNDILVYLKDFIKHEKHVKQIFKCLMKYNLHFKFKKCE